MITITHIDTACVLIEINGYRILTDPTLDEAGEIYYHGSGAFSKKTNSPALPVSGLDAIDLVLLSHHQHKDNFDNNGKKLAMTVPLVLSTKAASKSIHGITGLKEWETYLIKTEKVPGLKITATPARHHPWWLPEFIAGKVIGFIIEFDQQKNGVLYISGDTVYFKGIDDVARRFRVETAIFHLGSVQFRYLTGFGQYTMNAKGLVKSVRVLKPAKVIPVHYKGWSHFKESETTLRNILARHPLVNQKVFFLQPGIPSTI
jgi:L-ascorbate metabolism protein UlaG (beta-lactamase superfamily)